MSRPRASDEADYGLVYLEIIVAFGEGRIKAEHLAEVAQAYYTALMQYRQGTFDSQTIQAPIVYAADIRGWRQRLEVFIDGIEQVEARRARDRDRDKERKRPKSPFPTREIDNTGFPTRETDNRREEKKRSEEKVIKTEEEEAFRPSVSVSVFKGELSAQALKNPDHDPVSLAMALCKVEDVRNWNTFQKLLRLKGDGVFRDVLETFFAEIRQGEDVENRAAALTKRLNQYPDKKDGPRPSKTPANRTETDRPTPTDLKAQTATLAKSLFNHPRQANGSQAEAVGFEAELSSYAEKNGITDADTDGRCAPVLSELFKLGCGEALNKLPPRAKNAFACLFLDADEEGRKDLLAKLDEDNQKSTPQCADADNGEEIPF